MTATALLLVLLASVTHAFWNFLSKSTNGALPFIWLTYLASSVIFCPFVIWQFRHYSFANVSLVLASIALVSALLRLAYFVVLQTGYRRADLSVVYPLARGS